MFDGIFIHHLTDELQNIVNLRINKVNCINESDYFFILQNKQKLFFSLNSNNQHLRLTNMELVNTSKVFNFHKFLKKYFESSIITNISQYQNDRILIISCLNADDLGYKNEYKMIFEFFGRNANLIVTDKNYVIIDAYKKLLPTESFVAHDDRVILPKSNYTFPVSERINPFDNLDYEIVNISENIFQGISNLCFSEIVTKNDLSIISTPSNPVLIKNKKCFFYAFDLSYLPGERIYFNTLSQLLEYYFLEIKNENSKNNEQLFLQNYINKEIEKIKLKISKQQNELLVSQKNLEYEKLGNLLSCNLHLINKGDEKVIVTDFYNDNKDLEILLDSTLSPKKNLDNFFTKYNKAKRAINHINEQIIISQKEIEYLTCLLNQLEISKINDLKEIYDELGIKKEQNNRKSYKPNYLTFRDCQNNTILVGKNNLQNEYITHKLANKDDYFFHVQNIPGSHTILKTNNLTNELIELAATIAAYYSSYRNATNVCVDYTLIKYVKKVPGMKGSFVTYKNQKSIFVKPSLEYIKNKTNN